MSDDVRDLLEGAGHRVLDVLQQKPGWDELEERTKDALREAAFDLGKLTVLQLAGHDVSVELLHVQAQIASWEFRRANEARELWNQAVRELAHFVGAFLGGLIRSGL